MNIVVISELLRWDGDETAGRNVLRVPPCTAGAKQNIGKNILLEYYVTINYPGGPEV